jgi:hypothetical protein
MVVAMGGTAGDTIYLEKTDKQMSTTGRARDEPYGRYDITLPENVPLRACT